MGTATTGYGNIAGIRVEVLVKGMLRGDLYCTSIEQGVGTAGASATIEAPALRWDQGKGLLGATLRVRVDGRPAFTGLITTRSGAASAGANGTSFGAVSYAALMDTVYLGQEQVEERIEFSYPRFARRSGVLQATGWNPKTILRDIFSSSTPSWRGGGATIPAGWRAKLELGSLAAIDRTLNEFPLGDVAFRLTTLAEAIEQLLGIMPTIGFRERFTEGATALEFFELGDERSPVRRVVVARPGEHIADVGANVLSIGREDSLDGVRSRVISCGAPRRRMISVATNHATHALRKGWSTSLEADVLANPERGKAGLAGGGLHQHVFRRYLLPPELRDLLIDEKQAARSSTGAELPIQVWKLGRTLVQSGGAWTSTLDTVPTQLEGAAVDVAAGVITLKEPAINLVSSSLDGTDVVDVYEAAVVGVTLTVAGSRLTADTGIDGPEGVYSGLVRQVINESFEASSVNGTVASGSFTSCWYFDDALGPINVVGEVSVRDDAALLRAYTALALREANRTRASYAVTLPFFTEGFRLGDRIEVVGEDGYDYGTHQIRSVSWSLGADHQTTLSTDNQAPMIYQDLGGGG